MPVKQGRGKIRYAATYLRDVLGDVLAEGLHEICVLRPDDPIEFLAKFLYRSVDCELYFYDKCIYNHEMQIMLLQMEEEKENKISSIKSIRTQIRDLKRVIQGQERLRAALWARYAKSVLDRDICRRTEPTVAMMQPSMFERDLEGGEKAPEEFIMEKDEPDLFDIDIPVVDDTWAIRSDITPLPSQESPSSVPAADVQPLLPKKSPIETFRTTSKMISMISRIAVKFQPDASAGRLGSHAADQGWLLVEKEPEEDDGEPVPQKRVKKPKKEVKPPPRVKTPRRRPYDATLPRFRKKSVEKLEEVSIESGSSDSHESVDVAWEEAEEIEIVPLEAESETEARVVAGEEEEEERLLMEPELSQTAGQERRKKSVETIPRRTQPRVQKMPVTKPKYKLAEPSDKKVDSKGPTVPPRGISKRKSPAATSKKRTKELIAGKKEQRKDLGTEEGEEEREYLDAEKIKDEIEYFDTDEDREKEEEFGTEKGIAQREYLGPETGKERKEYLGIEKGIAKREYLGPETGKERKEYLSTEKGIAKREYLGPETARVKKEYLGTDKGIAKKEYLGPETAKVKKEYLGTEKGITKKEYLGPETAKVKKEYLGTEIGKEEKYPGREDGKEREKTLTGRSESLEDLESFYSDVVSRPLVHSVDRPHRDLSREQKVFLGQRKRSSISAATDSMTDTYTDDSSDVTDYSSITSFDKDEFEYGRKMPSRRPSSIKPGRRESDVQRYSQEDLLKSSPRQSRRQDVLPSVVQEEDLPKRSRKQSKRESFVIVQEEDLPGKGRKQSKRESFVFVQEEDLPRKGRKQSKRESFVIVQEEDLPRKGRKQSIREDILGTTDVQEKDLPPRGRKKVARQITKEEDLPQEVQSSVSSEEVVDEGKRTKGSRRLSIIKRKEIVDLPTESQKQFAQEEHLLKKGRRQSGKWKKREEDLTVSSEDIVDAEEWPKESRRRYVRKGEEGVELEEEREKQRDEAEDLETWVSPQTSVKGWDLEAGRRRSLISPKEQPGAAYEAEGEQKVKKRLLRKGFQKRVSEVGPHEREKREKLIHEETETELTQEEIQSDETRRWKNITGMRVEEWEGEDEFDLVTGKKTKRPRERREEDISPSPREEGVSPLSRKMIKALEERSIVSRQQKKPKRPKPDYSDDREKRKLTKPKLATRDESESESDVESPIASSVGSQEAYGMPSRRRRAPIVTPSVKRSDFPSVSSLESESQDSILEMKRESRRTGSPRALTRSGRVQGPTGMHIRHVSCKWYLATPRVLVCKHPILGEIRCHRPRYAAGGDMLDRLSPEEYHWQALYDHETYTVSDPYHDDEIYQSLLIDWTREDWI